MNYDKLFYDWSKTGLSEIKSKAKVTLLDESLRDGIQSSFVKTPNLEEQKRLIQAMDEVGIEFLDIGFPGSGKAVFDTIAALLAHVRQKSFRIVPTCAARTHRGDIQPIVELSEIFGSAIEPLVFVAASPIRQLVEEWTSNDILFLIEDSLRFSRSQGLNPTLVIEDATRSSKEILTAIYKLAMELDVHRIVLCDTVGFCTPDSTQRIVEWTFSYFAEHTYKMNLDWHGHNDKGLGVANSIRAFQSGCDRIHGTALGIGERAGNTAIDQLIVNLYLEGYGQWSTSKLKQYIVKSAQAYDITVPQNYPVFGDSVFSTASGIHASAIIKAEKTGNPDLTNYVYSAVPATDFDRKNTIEINATSGKSNVKYFLESKGLTFSDYHINEVLAYAKRIGRTLTSEEILQMMSRFDREKCLQNPSTVN